jgi:hypothetical protein
VPDILGRLDLHGRSAYTLFQLLQVLRAAGIVVRDAFADWLYLDQQTQGFLYDLLQQNRQQQQQQQQQQFQHQREHQQAKSVGHGNFWIRRVPRQQIGGQSSGRGQQLGNSSSSGSSSRPSAAVAVKIEQHVKIEHHVKAEAVADAAPPQQHHGSDQADL